MRWALLCLLLASCGGGGGGQPIAQSPPPGHVVGSQSYFGFWYTVPGQLDATKGSVNVVFCQADSPDIAWDESLLIQCAQEAAAHGIHNWIASVGGILFGPGFVYRGAAPLGPLCQQFTMLGISPLGLYLLDEADHYLGKSAATLIPQAAADVRKACPGPKLAIVYANSTPGMAALDWVGFDDGTNADQLDKLPPLNPGQQYIIVPYGSDDYRRDPAPYVAFAQAHPGTVVLAYAWGTFGQHQGIATNGMAPAYLAAGRAIIGP